MMTAATAITRAQTGGDASGSEGADCGVLTSLGYRPILALLMCAAELVTRDVRENETVAARSILHIDMDAFYVSVELVRNPELRGSPVVVGGTGRRGVVAAASYEARFYGVHSAMPSAQAQRLCPHAVFLAGDHDLYAEVSQRVMAVFRDVTPIVEPLSLDEAFLDVTGALRSQGNARHIARTIRERIYDTEGLTCTVGIAPNKFLAKLGSEQAKPKASPKGPVYGSGIFEIEPGEEIDFLTPLPVRTLWGVGPATAKRLTSLGVETVGELRQFPEQRLVSALGRASGSHLHALSHAIDNRAVEPGRGTKSISHEETFAHDMMDRGELDVELVRQSDAVALRLRRSELAARTVQLKVRFGDFSTISRRRTADQPFTSSATVLALARSLFAEVDVTPGVRLLGVGVANLLTDPGQQLALDLGAANDDDEATGRSDEELRTDQVVDDVRERFGSGAIGPASTAVDGTLRVKRRGEQQWGPNSDDSAP